MHDLTLSLLREKPGSGGLLILYCVEDMVYGRRMSQISLTGSVWLVLHLSEVQGPFNYFQNFSEILNCFIVELMCSWEKRKLQSFLVHHLADIHAIVFKYGRRK
jgi:hypothetical protein